MGIEQAATSIRIAGTFSDENTGPKKRNDRGGPKHDALHMAEGLTYCWCMCAKCWTKNGLLGRCTCSYCPCGGRFITR